jgi:hypothetical protein
MMQKTTIALVVGLAGLAAGSFLSNASSAAGPDYGQDRAEIYASTFTPDGILDYGELRG